MSDVQKFFIILVCLGFVWWVFDCWRKGGYDDSKDDDYFDGEP